MGLGCEAYTTTGALGAFELESPAIPYTCRCETAKPLSLTWAAKAVSMRSLDKGDLKLAAYSEKKEIPSPGVQLFPTLFAVYLRGIAARANF